MFLAIIKKHTPKSGANLYSVFYTSDCLRGEVKSFSEHQLVHEVLSGKHTLVNASVDGISGKIVEDFGSLKRLEPTVSGLIPHVILAKYCSPTGGLLGYFLLNTATGAVVRAKPDAVYAAARKAKSLDAVFLQNGIYRFSDGKDQIAAFPGKNYYTFFQKLKKKPQKLNSEVDVRRNKENLEKQQSQKYTKEQLAELNNAKKCGVDPILIANPKLSPEQMRTLWVGKKNKACIEYFANPKYSLEQMQFLAERIISKQAAVECRALINPRYTVDQMNEIYLGIFDGVDYTLYAKPEVSADDMYLKRKELLASDGRWEGDLDVIKSSLMFSATTSMEAYNKKYGTLNKSAN